MIAIIAIGVVGIAAGVALDACLLVRWRRARLTSITISGLRPGETPIYTAEHSPSHLTSLGETGGIAWTGSAKGTYRP